MYYMEYIDVRNRTLQINIILGTLLIGILLLLIFYLFEMNIQLEFIICTLGVFSLVTSLMVFISFLKGNLKRQSKELSNYLKNKYQLENVFISNDLNGIMGINTQNKVFYLIKKAEMLSELVDNELYTIEAFPFNGILQINIIENDVKITKSTNKDSIGKSVEGGFGIDTYKGKSINRMRIQVITNDIMKPTSDVLICNYGQGITRGSEVDVQLNKVTDAWINRLILLINKSKK